MAEAGDRRVADAAGTGPRAVLGRAYWDAAQVAPTSPAAREALLAALDDGWADPERLHREGRTARMLLDGAREAVAAALGARTEEVALTGSHTAAVHAAVLGTLLGRRRAGDRLVHSAVEHSAVLACASWHAGTAEGSPVAVPVDLHARIDLDRFVAEVAQPGTAVAALQSANGEVGTRQPVVEVLDACRAAGVPLVVDAAASAGHEPLPPSDVVAADPRAWGAPPGTGVLVVRAGVRWRSPWPQDAAVPGDRAGVPGGAGVPQALAAAVGLQAALAERDAYLELLKTYYGDAATIDDLYKYTWARIPHFYNSPYYVYQYATCFASSAKLFKDMTTGSEADKKAATARYLTLLKSGGDDHPMEQLKKAGVDLTKRETVQAVVDQMDELVSLLEKEAAKVQ